MNDLIRQVADAGLSGTVYNTFLALSFVAWYVFNLHYRKKYQFTFAQATIISAVIWPVAYGLLFVLGWIESLFSTWGSHNIVRGFIYFPLIAILLAKLLKLKTGKVIDYIAPGVALCQAVAHIGCNFAGCCYGYKSSWGIWNPVYESYMVPNQLMESLAAFLTFLFCTMYAKKHNYDGSTKVYPLFLILFGFTRFFLEFLRNNHKVLGPFSSPALHCALMFFVGIVWLCYIWDKEARTAKRKVKHSSK